jgi:hypothetical protein
LEPLLELGGVGVNGCAAATGEAMDGKVAVGLPALDGAFAATEVVGDLLPAVETLAACGCGGCVTVCEW